MSPDSEPTPRVPWLPVNEGAQPSAPAPAPADPFEGGSGLTPAKPTLPAWIRRDDVPEAVDEDDDDSVVAPFAPPPAEEVLPSPVDQSAAESAEAAESAAPGDDAEPGLWASDPVHMLGESAVASAALSAGGAPTPLGGVPVVAPESPVTPPEFGDDAPLFTPRFLTEDEPEVPHEGSEANTVEVPAVAGLTDAGLTDAGLTDAAANPAAPDFIADHRTKLFAQAEALDSSEIYVPMAFAAVDPEAEFDGADDPGVDSADDAPTVIMDPVDTATAEQVVVTAAAAEVPDAGDEGNSEGTPPPPTTPKKSKRLWWLWALIAVILAAGVATAVVLLNRPEDIVVPGTTVTEPPATPTITPIAPPTDTEFQAAMPTEVGTFALVEAVALDPTDVALGAGRIADGIDLTYSSGDDAMEVRALQYYNEADATQMFTHFAGEGAATEPVVVNGQTVGDSAIITSPAPGIVWRNGTSLFVLTGPPGQLQDFYALFGL